MADHNRLLLENLLGAEIRLGSLAALNLGDVDLKWGAIHIRTKAGRDKVPLNSGLTSACSGLAG